MPEQEAYAIIWGMEAFEKFLWGWPFIIRTDHWALQFLFEGPAKAERSARDLKIHLQMPPTACLFRVLSMHCLN